MIVFNMFLTKKGKNTKNSICEKRIRSDSRNIIKMIDQTINQEGMYFFMEVQGV